MNASLIKQGDSLIWLARPNTLADGDLIDGSWACRAGLFAANGTASVAVATITDKYTSDGEEYFLVVIGTSDTAGLTPGTYTLAIDIRNDSVTPAYSDETPITVVVESQRIIV